MTFRPACHRAVARCVRARMQHKMHGAQLRQMLQPCTKEMGEGTVHLDIVSDDRSGFVCLHTLAKKFHANHMAYTASRSKPRGAR
jgi:hypothetical protein